VYGGKLICTYMPCALTGNYKIYIAVKKERERTRTRDERTQEKKEKTARENKRGRTARENTSIFYSHTLV
jgi:hypothetical protein